MDTHNASLEEKLRKVYSETTIDHVLHPRNVELFPDPDGFAVYRSNCSESMKLWVKIRNGFVADAAFWTDGCAATVACGSMATDLIKGKTVTQALALTAGDIAEALNLPEGNFHCAELAARSVRMALTDYLTVRQQPWKKLYRK